MLSLQQTRPRQSISQTQSLAVIQTLLRAGLGCITFLRNLLPDDNFSESHFTTSDDTTPSSSQVSSSSAGNQNSNQRISGFKIMTMARGYSEEADRILDYLEYGIFDALEKKYLRSFIFAIYLDNKDPANIVEAYTFNFRYHKLPGCDVVVPIMTLGDNLRSSPTVQDPVTEAAKRGKVPTLRDVKKSVKTLLKTLIHAMSQMDVLPKRRYATFKIFYTEDTPVDYEPPYFQPGDAEKDRWYLMTHNLEEVPDKWSIGKIDTGHHSVHLNITSIATYLPSTEPEEATFSGTIESNLVRPNLTPMQEVAIRAQQTEQQEKDAEMRNLVWSADADVCDGERDADGEDDPDYVRQPDGSLDRIKDSHILVPVGLRNESGSIQAIDNPSALEPAAAIYGGSLESIPLQLKDLPEQVIDPDTQCDETQAFDFEPPHSPLPPSDPVVSLTPSPNSDIKSISNDTKTSLTDDVGMGLLVEKMTLEDNVTEPGQQDPQTPTRPPEYPQNMKTVNDIPHHIDPGIVACECDIPTEDECCFCEGSCSRWYHIWCMGYHSVDDKRIPAKFICFDCRLRSDVSWQLIKSDLYPRLMVKHRDLALFRRAIKTAEVMKSMSPVNFAKRLGTSFVQSRQLLKRLEEEGFIQEHIAITDELGITKTRPKKQGNSKQKPRRNNMQKSQYHFNKAILKTLAYRDYFDPSLQTENKLLGISEMTAKYNMRLATVKPKPAAFVAGDNNDSHTQEDGMVVDNVVPTTWGAKRLSGNDEDNPPKKKIKISVTTGVDLAE